MKKLSYFIWLLMIVTALTACGGRSTPAENGDSTPQVDTNQIDLNDVDYPNIEDAVPFCTVDLSTTDYDTELAITIVAPVSHITTIIIDEKTLAFEADDPRHVEISYPLSDSDYGHELVIQASGTDNVTCEDTITIQQPEPKKDYVAQSQQAMLATHASSDILASQSNSGVSTLNPQAAVVSGSLADFSCSDKLGATIDDDGMCVCDIINGFERNPSTGDCECRSGDGFILDDNACVCDNDYLPHTILAEKRCEPITNIDCGMGHFDPSITDGNKCVCETGALSTWDSYQETAPELLFLACNICNADEGFILTTDGKNCECDKERGLVYQSSTQTCGCASGYEMIDGACKPLFVKLEITVNTGLKSVTHAAAEEYYIHSYRKGDLNICIGDNNDSCNQQGSFLKGLPEELQGTVTDSILDDYKWNFYKGHNRDILTSTIHLSTWTADKKDIFPMKIEVPDTDSLMVTGIKVEGVYKDGSKKILYFHPCLNRWIRSKHPLILKLDDLGICYQTGSATTKNAGAYLPRIELLTHWDGTPNKNTMAYDVQYSTSWGKKGQLLKHRSGIGWARWMPDNYQQYILLQRIIDDGDENSVALGSPSMSLHAKKTEYNRSLRDVWKAYSNFHWMSMKAHVFGTYVSGGANLIADWKSLEGPALQIRVIDKAHWTPDHIHGKIFKPGVPIANSLEDKGYVIRIAHTQTQHLSIQPSDIIFEYYAKDGSNHVGGSTTWPEEPGSITFEKLSNKKIFTQNNFDNMTSFSGDAYWE